MDSVRLVFESLASFRILALLLLLIIIIIILTLISLIRKATSPVSTLPGPFLTKFTVLPIVYKDHFSQRTTWTHHLHQKYGPIVRLSPTEVSVYSPESIRDVFTGSAKTGYYAKAPLFNIFQHFGARNAFSSIHSEQHLWRRKVVAGSYAMTNIVAKEAKYGRIWRNVGNFMKLIEREGVRREDGNDKAVEFFSACRFYSADNITSHLFVSGSEALNGDQDVRERIEGSAEGPGDVMSYFKMEFEELHVMLLALKRVTAKVFGLSQARSGRIRPALASGKKVELESGEWYGGTPIRDWGWKRFLATREALVNGAIEATTDGPVAAKLASNALDGEALPLSKKLSDNDDAGLRFVQTGASDGGVTAFYRNQGCASECMDQFLAGLDTVGDTLAYVFRLLSQPEHNDVRETLQRECKRLGLSSEYDSPLTSTQISDVLANPWIDAILKETLRAYPASTTAFQRVVPEGGRLLDGHFVPEGTIIGGTPVTVNYDSSVFDRSAKFDVREWHPQRWLEADAKSLAEMNRRLWTFGSGGRGCIGKHLAILEMKLLIAAVYSGYSTSIDEETPLPKPRNHPSSRTSFRDMDWFKSAKGGLAFHPLQT